MYTYKTSAITIHNSRSTNLSLSKTSLHLSLSKHIDTMGDFRAPMNSSPAVHPAPARSVPFREDCWSEAATETLVDAWGKRYLELNHGNLRQKDWQEVAEAVNSRHGHSIKTIRTDIQCKNRIDTVKKKYKAEKARVSDSDAVFVSSWPLFNKLDGLILPKKSELFSRKSVSGGSGFGRGEASKTPPKGSGFIGYGRGEALSRGTSSRTPPMAIALEREVNQLPLAVAVTPHKMSLAVADDSNFRRNYSVMAAAAAKQEYEEQERSEEEEQGYEEEERSEETGEEEREVRQAEINPTEKLAMAIERFGATYEKVEMEKLRQFMEIEQKRIDVGRDVELKRTQMLMDTQIQLEKLKRKHAKKKSSGLDDICSS